MSTAALTRAYRVRTLALRARTVLDWQRLWPALDWTRLDATFPAWLVGAGAIVRRDRVVAAGLASAYVKAHRLTAGVSGSAVVKLADPVPVEQLVTALRVSTLVAAKKAALAGQSAEVAMANTFVQSSGAGSRLVLDAGRETVTRSAAADPRTSGWQRVTSGNACEFCSSLGASGVYTGPADGFQSHGHCACSAEPAYI